MTQLIIIKTNKTLNEYILYLRFLIFKNEIVNWNHNKIYHLQLFITYLISTLTKLLKLFVLNSIFKAFENISYFLFWLIFFITVVLAILQFKVICLKIYFSKIHYTYKWRTCSGFLYTYIAVDIHQEYRDIVKHIHNANYLKKFKELTWRHFYW